jgi:hypothetical protein
MTANNRFTRFLVIIASGVAFATASVADDYDDRLAIANDYAAMAAADMDINALIDQMWKPMVQGFEVSGKTVTDAQIDKLRAVYRDNFAEPLLELMSNQGPVLASIYTLDELKALHAFYLTPEGQGVMSKMPQLLEQQQPEIMQLVMSNMGPIMQAMQEILQ